MKLSDAVDSLEGKEKDAIQSNPNRLEKWACVSLFKFYKAKSNIPAPGSR